jgi:hypothetical protein
LQGVSDPPVTFLVEPQPTAKTIEIKIKMRFIPLSLTSDDNQQDDEPEQDGIVRSGVVPRTIKRYSPWS